MMFREPRLLREVWGTGLRGAITRSHPHEHVAGPKARARSR